MSALILAEKPPQAMVYSEVFSKVEKKDDYLGVFCTRTYI